MKPENEPLSVPTESRPTHEELAERITGKIQSLLTDKYTNSFKIAYGIIRQELDAASSSLLPVPDELEKFRTALTKINDIRNSLVGFQSCNFSEHAYPLVAALDEAGFEGMPYPESKEYFGTMLERTLAAEARVKELESAASLPVGESDLGCISVADTKDGSGSLPAASDPLIEGRDPK